MIYMIVILIFSMVIHEMAHGIAAYLSGDDTAKSMGRLSLNPLKHLDPAGTIFPILMILSGSGFVIGWAKPVPVSYWKLKHGRWSEFFVASAGIGANFILALLGALAIKYRVGFFRAANYMVLINLTLMVFNLIPIPPLDGSKILASIGGKDMRASIFHMERYGILAVMVLAYFGIIGKFMDPVIHWLVDLLNWIISL